MTDIHTFNPYYNYPNKSLWEAKAWEDRFTCLVPLIHFIQAKNQEMGNEYVTPFDETKLKEDGFNYRYLDPAIEQYWKEKGMLYGSCGLGGVCLIPEKYYADRSKEPEVLLAFCEKKQFSPNRVQDIFRYFDAYNHMCAEEYKVAMYVPSFEGGVDYSTRPIMVLQELASLYHLTYQKLWLDVSTVYKAGVMLKDVPGFVLRTADGELVADPDALVTEVGTLKIPCLNISGIWGNKDSLAYECMCSPEESQEIFDQRKIFNTGIGREMTDGMYLEKTFDDARDPALLAYWDRMGVKCEFHHLCSEQYITFTPKCAFERPEEKLPVMAIFQEVTEANPHQAVTAFSQYYQMIQIAAEGDFLIVFFALETPEENDLLTDILQEVNAVYPVDLSRVYLIGHSHNGGLASHYIRRHPKQIACVATCGTNVGFAPPMKMGGAQTMSCTLEEIELMSTFDQPTVNINGLSERGCFPVYEARLDPRMPEPVDVRVKHWQYRLHGSRCPQVTKEQVLACRESEDYVERKLGVPFDKTEVLYLNGSENLIGDVKNVDGKYHLRIIAHENMLHAVTPPMLKLAWSYMRRFARDLTTGEVVELY